jgi:hypothetical protein
MTPEPRELSRSLDSRYSYRRRCPISRLDLFSAVARRVLCTRCVCVCVCVCVCLSLCLSVLCVCARVPVLFLSLALALSLSLSQRHGRCGGGPPNADIEKDMREEHTERDDSHVDFFDAQLWDHHQPREGVGARARGRQWV